LACRASKGLASGVAGFEQADQLGAASVADALGGFEQQPACPVEVIVFGAAPAGGLVVDSAAHVVDGRVGELDDVEQVGDLGGLGECFAGGLAIRPRQVHDRPADAFLIHPGFCAGCKYWSEHGIYGFRDEADADVEAVFG